MKKRIIIPLVAAAILFSGQIFAQGFGLRAGVNLANLNGKNAAGGKMENDLKTGFHVGVNYEGYLAPEFYLQPGLLYTTKGAKLSNNGKVNLGYIELPINFVYKPELGMGKLIVGFGPYLAYGINGKATPPNGSERKITFTKEASALDIANWSHYKPFDAGANLMFGYETASRISLQLNAGLGLIDIHPDVSGVSNEATRKNTTFGLSLGYRLGE